MECAVALGQSGEWELTPRKSAPERGGFLVHPIAVAVALLLEFEENLPLSPRGRDRLGLGTCSLANLVRELWA